MQRRSVPTIDLQEWKDRGWSYVMPDFDKPGHSVVRRVGRRNPSETPTEKSHE